MRTGNVAALTAACLLRAPSPATPPVVAAGLKPATVQAFEGYVRGAEARQDERRSFLRADELPETRERLRRGEIVIEPLAGKGELEVPGGLIHDWIGAVFVPGVSLDKAMSLVRDYASHKNIYREVTGSRILDRNGDAYRVFLRLTRKKVVTVVLNTEHDVRYVQVDGRRWRSRSYSTRIAEVDKPGTPEERELPPGQDHGFLWRLYSYWRFEETGGGVAIECEAISLTRDVPRGLGWLIQPIIRSLPRESLAGTLEATREALKRQPAM